MTDPNDRDPVESDTPAAGGDAETSTTAQKELFEAVDHFKNAASILFRRATADPAVSTATREAKRVVEQIGEAAEPLAHQLTAELGRLTKDILRVVDAATGAQGNSASVEADDGDDLDDDDLDDRDHTEEE